MKAEDVDPALVEIIAKRRYEVTRLTDKYPANWPSWEMLADSDNALTLAYREAFLNGARGDLAAVIPEIQAQARLELLEGMRDEVKTWHVYDSRDTGDVYPSDSVVDLIQDRIDTLTVPTSEEPTDA